MEDRNQIEKRFLQLQRIQDELSVVCSQIIYFNQFLPLTLTSVRFFDSVSSMKRLNEKLLFELSRNLYPHICSWCGIGYEGQSYMVEGYVWPLCIGCTRMLNLTERVRAQRERAKKLNLPAMLTLDEWLVSLEHWGWYCAYCQNTKAYVLEHFIPLSYGPIEGAGTTIGNCVPSCHHCNRLKSNLHPDEVTAIPKETIDYVREQLRLLSGGALL
jgi:5-methylcytosine-specific restriction endonuclease McrA